ncbi:MAG: transglutaminase family protein [Verrucomicrobiota bacterium]
MKHKQKIFKVAREVEAFLEFEGITLTMGGEPTFIPAQPEAAEWNNAAMGPEKLGYARRMTAQLLDEVYPGALAMQVFGKWYPGEPLPRWNCLSLHQKDGKALWPDTKRLLLDDVRGGNLPRTATAVARAIAKALGVSRSLIRAVEQTGSDKKTTGWVLPLQFEEGSWISDQWPYDKENLLRLIPGDSPVGLRLPLSDLPEDHSRGALTVEVRQGALEIFLPPLEWRGFKSLIQLILKIVRELKLKDLVFCGYGPSGSGDYLDTVGLAADPGVLEVNLPPATNWEAYHRFWESCASAATACELQLTKFGLNGRVAGTGGGSHLAFGGVDEATNPFLVQPDRIASLLRYWQHHPALSYIFSGQYVGPGSQAPRVDEGPLHGLYELEVACEGIEGALPGTLSGESIDQFLKNLMTDSAGNTHRAELCFDKFHNLAAPNGCIGIIEMRAFETFPEASSMSVIALFIRTIIARLFRVPFREGLRRFGPELHDKYFLPGFLWDDLKEICDDLNAHGFAFDVEWLRSAFDFRCPSLGKMRFKGGVMELNQAFESWPLMAEESLESSMVRVVDNSSDRLQVKLSDASLIQTGYLLVNGIEVPFEKVDGQLIAGVRYKCASAYPALHPHVPIQSPLSFEWVDRKTGATTQAYRYHFWNPDGPVYDGRPKDATEASARRKVRWLRATDLIGRQPMVFRPKMSPEYRYTLDLRRQLI